MTPEQEFRKVIKGTNFVTPDIIRYGCVGKYVYELSTGMLMGTRMYGVTVVADGKISDLSASFISIEDAEKYIKEAFK